MGQVIDARIDGSSRVFFVTGGRTAIVDGGWPGSEWKVLKALKMAGIPREQVSLLIATHGHVDHYGSLRALKAALAVPVMAGWPDAGCMEKGENAPTASASPGTAPTTSRGQDDVAVSADVIVREDVSLRDFGIAARVLTTPGHTAGSLSVLADDGGCVTGDFLASLYTAPPGLAERGLQKLAAAGARCFYPSHTPCLDAATVFARFPPRK
jgi:hydroxyacylglutathione hydrolase